MEINRCGFSIDSIGIGQSSLDNVAFGAVDAGQILERLDSKKQQAARNLGILASEVETIPFDLSRLENEGIFLNVDCCGFSLLERQIEWNSLGVELPAKRAVRLSAPRVGLLPDVYRRKLLRASAQAHYALSKYSFRFTLCESVWGTSEYKWVPWNAFESFESDFQKSAATLAEAKNEVLENYDEILTTLQRSFAELAEDSAKRLEATIRTGFDRTDFMTNVVARAMAMVPTREVIRSGLSISMKPKVILLGSEIEAEKNVVRRIKLENEKLDADREAVRIELDTRQTIESERLQHFETERQREQEVKERIRQLKIEAAREAAAEAVSPLREGLAQITGRIYEAAREMAQKLQTTEFVPGSLAKRARQMCEWYAMMNFTGDTSLEEVLANLQTIAERGAKVRSREEMQSALGEVLRATSLQSKRLLEDDRLDALEI